VEHQPSVVRAKELLAKAVSQGALNETGNLLGLANMIINTAKGAAAMEWESFAGAFPDESKSAQDQGEIAEMILRKVTHAADAAEAASLLYWLEVVRDRLWVGVAGSENEFLDAALPETGDRKWRHVLRNAPKVLLPLQEQPIALEDGSTLTAEMLAVHPSIVQDLIPAVAGLDLEEEADRAKFDQAVVTGLTVSRDDMRGLLAQQGLRDSPEPTTTCVIKRVPVVNTQTGEKTDGYDLSIGPMGNLAFQAIKRRLKPFVIFKEAASAC
jgi:hypothetical protein